MGPVGICPMVAMATRFGQILTESLEKSINRIISRLIHANYTRAEREGNSLPSSDFHFVFLFMLLYLNLTQKD